MAGLSAVGLVGLGLTCLYRLLAHIGFDEVCTAEGFSHTALKARFLGADILERLAPCREVADSEPPDSR